MLDGHCWVIIAITPTASLQCTLVGSQLLGIDCSRRLETIPNLVSKQPQRLGALGLIERTEHLIHLTVEAMENRTQSSDIPRLEFSQPNETGICLRLIRFKNLYAIAVIAALR